MFHDGCHVFTATFDRHAEGEHRAAADVRIWGLEVLLNHRPERGEDLSRGEGGGQTINYSQRRLENASGVEGFRQKHHYARDKVRLHQNLRAPVRW